MAEWAKGRLRSQLPVLAQALTGLVRAQHRRWVALPLAHLACLEEPLDALSADLARLLTALRATPPPPPPVAWVGATAAGGSAAEPVPPAPPMTLARAVPVLDTSPGVQHRGGERWVAAGGIAMARCGTAARLAAWSGVAPGHDASAGQQRSGKTRQGHRALRTGRTPLAHAAACTKDTSLSAG
jgi:Transposase IS116/IS110/IS902 family